MKLLEKIFGHKHKWKHNSTVWTPSRDPDNPVKDTHRTYYCTSCHERKHEFSNPDLTEDQKQKTIEEDDAGIKAMIWLLDNVEPTVSVEVGPED